MGITTEPLDDADFGISGFVGAELGYSFAERFELRVFYTTGIGDHSSFFGSINTSSEFNNWGIKPQYNFISKKNRAVNFAIGAPLSVWTQKTRWHYEPEGLFPAFGNDASGMDKAQFIRLAIAPRLRFHIQKVRLIFELGPNINLDKLQKAERRVDYNYTGENYATATPNNQVASVEFQFSIGYLFW